MFCFHICSYLLFLKDVFAFSHFKQFFNTWSFESESSVCGYLILGGSATHQTESWACWRYSMWMCYWLLVLFCTNMSDPVCLTTAVYCGFFFSIYAALVGFESNNKYEVRNSMGQNVFYAVEENDCLSRQCCGPVRSFTIHVLDNFGQELITVTRPLKCMSCFFPCCLQEVRGATFRHVHFVPMKLQCSRFWFWFTILLLKLFWVRIWLQITLFSHNPSLSWRCRLPLGTQWGTLYNSGTRSPLNSLLQMNTKSLYSRYTGPSVDGAAFQMLTLRWVYLNNRNPFNLWKHNTT